MSLYRLSVVEEFVTAPDAEAALREAFHDSPDDLDQPHPFDFINVEEMAGPVAVVLLTKDDLATISHRFTPGIDLQAKLDQAITQIAVQTVMIEREGE